MPIADPPLQETLDLLAKDDEEYIERHDDGTLTVTLDEPIKIHKGRNREPEERSELVLRKARARDWMETDKAKGEISKTAYLLSALTGIPIASIEDMDGDDFMRVCRVVGTMGGNPLKTGGTPSES